MTVRVVVADDQAPFRRAARSVLTVAAEFDLVGEARSGEEAIALVDRLRPDLVLMDIAMPGIGGIEAARSISSRFPDTVTILVSTYRKEDLPTPAWTCGAAAYLHKSEFGEDALGEVWSGGVSRLPKGKGARPSRACAPRSPRSARA